MSFCRVGNADAPPKANKMALKPKEKLTTSGMEWVGSGCSGLSRTNWIMIIMIASAVDTTARIDACL